jgi:hypothetical protein
MRLLFLLLAPPLPAAPYLYLEPSVITQCRNGTGAARVYWDAEGAAGPVRVFANGAAMTADSPSIGAENTGTWITDGLLFELRDASDAVLAATRAVVRCASPAPWWPLDVGNEWHFRVNDRFSTGAHTTWRVLAKQRIQGVEWTRVRARSELLLRVDAEERIWQRNGDGTESLLLDPSGRQNGRWGLARPGNDVSFTPIGVFGADVSYSYTDGLGRFEGQLSRGIGPTWSQSFLMTGSSGGLLDSLTIIEARIAGVRYALPFYRTLSLTLETNSANVSEQRARNCRLPCYFAACGFGPSPPDSPDAYKPCIEASLTGGAGRVALLDAQSKTMFDGPIGNGYARIPLWQNRDELLPPGPYVVRVTTTDGAVIAQPLQIR